VKEIEATGGKVIGISYDPEETLKKFTRKSNITYPLLSDPGSKTIKAYGILNEEAVGSRIDGVPYPGTFVIDSKGIIRSKLFLEGYRDRHGIEALIKAIKEAK
jgi:peroxiredoxin Q/BCP